jgi:DNA gyrase/topoisomerase IV subunit B
MHEGMRTRTRMYIGEIGQIGFSKLISELIHVFASELNALGVNIHVNENGIVTVKFEHMQGAVNKLLSLLHYPKLPDNKWRFELVLIQSLSKRTEMKIGSATYLCDCDGHITPELIIPPAEPVTHFEIAFQPDEKIMEAQSPDVLALCERLYELTLVCPGLKIVYRDDNTEPFTQMVWRNPKGIRLLLEATAKKYYYNWKFEHGFQFDQNGLKGEVYWFIAGRGSKVNRSYSFANGEATAEGGSHVTGCMQGILDGLKVVAQNDAMREYDFSVSRGSQHIWIAVSIWTGDIGYAGSTKDCVEYEPIRKTLRKLVADYVKAYCEANTDEARQVTYYFVK